MADKLMYIPNLMTHVIPSSVDYKYWLKHLDTQLNESTNPKSAKVPKVVKQTNKEKCKFETLGTSVINSQFSPPLSLSLSD